MYVFAGDGKGGFAAPKTLDFKDGKPLTVGSAMHVATADWDRDGDVDLVIGNIQGEVHFVPNVGTTKAPVWGPATALKSVPEPTSTSEKVRSMFRRGRDDGTISAPGGDAGPLVADFDGDGAIDLLVGAGDGSIRFYRNTAAQGAPKLAAPVIVVAARKSDAKSKDAHTGHDIRAKLALGDWNGDGRTDLLVGDFYSREGPQPTLTEAQTAERDALRKELEKVYEQMAPIFERAQKAADAAVPVKDGAERSEEDAVRWSDAFQAAMEKDPEHAALQKRQEEFSAKLKPLEPEHLMGGSVWVYLAKPAAP